MRERLLIQTNRLGLWMSEEVLRLLVLKLAVRVLLLGVVVVLLLLEQLLVAEHPEEVNGQGSFVSFFFSSEVLDVIPRCRESQRTRNRRLGVSKDKT